MMIALNLGYPPIRARVLSPTGTLFLFVEYPPPRRVVIPTISESSRVSWSNDDVPSRVHPGIGHLTFRLQRVAAGEAVYE